MQATQLLHTLLSESSTSMHKARKNSLIAAVESCIRGEKLVLTEIGRNMTGAAKTKNNIKRVDYLLANGHLLRERSDIYGLITRFLTGSLKQPIIIVDWSTLNATAGTYVLRASVISKGRALTLYEEMHDDSSYNNNKTHNRFLNNLKNILPTNSKPIIITDAGFRIPWFKAVLELGWDFVGRERNTTYYKTLELTWEPCSKLHDIATKRGIYVGTVMLAKSKEFKCEIFIKKISDKRENEIKKYKSRCKTYMRYRSSCVDPWVIVTSLQGGEAIKNKVFNLLI